MIDAITSKVSIQESREACPRKSDAHALQERVLGNLTPWNSDADSIRSALSQDEIAATDIRRYCGGPSFLPRTDLSRTPGWSSLRNSTPALLRTAATLRKVSVLAFSGPSNPSMRLMVPSATLAFVDSSICVQPRRARARPYMSAG